MKSQHLWIEREPGKTTDLGVSSLWLRPPTLVGRKCQLYVERSMYGFLKDAYAPNSSQLHAQWHHIGGLQISHWESIYAMEISKDLSHSGEPAV